MTDAGRASAPRRLGLTPIELRLYAVALLGAVYLVAWRAIAPGGAAPAAGPAAAPEGGQVVERTRATEPAPRVIRAPAPRGPLRVRTRSS